MEIAIADGDYDPYAETWRSPEIAAEFRRNYPNECPGPDRSVTVDRHE